MKKAGMIFGIILILGALIGIKALVLNVPKEDPREISQKIMDFMQSQTQTESEKAAIRGYFTKDLVDRLSTDTDQTQSEDSSVEQGVVVTIQNVEESESRATVTLEVSAWILKVPFQLKYVKQGDFWKGYKWMVDDVITPDLNLDDSTNAATSTNSESTSSKANEKFPIGRSWFLQVSNPVDFEPTSEFEKADGGKKFVAVEVIYSNESETADSINPANLTLRDTEGHSYELSFISQKEPSLSFGTTVTPNGIAKGYITYEVASGVLIDKAVYANSDTTVTVSFE